jgi:hypothetical protein
MLGLLTIKDGRDRRRLAWSAFAMVVGAHVVLRVIYHFVGIASDGGESVLGTVLKTVEYMVMFVGGAFGLIYTHDEVVRSYPRLGAPILFLRSVELPPIDGTG